MRCREAFDQIKGGQTRKGDASAQALPPPGNNHPEAETHGEKAK
jgi:hypothetical protein